MNVSGLVDIVNLATPEPTNEAVSSVGICALLLKCQTALLRSDELVSASITGGDSTSRRQTSAGFLAATDAPALLDDVDALVLPVQKGLAALVSVLLQSASASSVYAPGMVSESLDTVLTNIFDQPLSTRWDPRDGATRLHVAMLILSLLQSLKEPLRTQSFQTTLEDYAALLVDCQGYALQQTIAGPPVSLLTRSSEAAFQAISIFLAGAVTNDREAFDNGAQTLVDQIVSNAFHDSFACRHFAIQLCVRVCTAAASGIDSQRWEPAARHILRVLGELVQNPGCRMDVAARLANVVNCSLPFAPLSVQSALLDQVLPERPVMHVYWLNSGEIEGVHPTFMSDFVFLNTLTWSRLDSGVVQRVVPRLAEHLIDACNLCVQMVHRQPPREAYFPRASTAIIRAASTFFADSCVMKYISPVARSTLMEVFVLLFQCPATWQVGSAFCRSFRNNDAHVPLPICLPQFSPIEDVCVGPAAVEMFGGFRHCLKIATVCQLLVGCATSWLLICCNFQRGTIVTHMFFFAGLTEHSGATLQSSTCLVAIDSTKLDCAAWKFLLFGDPS